MQARIPAHTACRTSRWFVALAILVCGILLLAVVQTLALSSPYPTPKQREWILEPSAIGVASRRPASPVPAPAEAVPAEAVPVAESSPAEPAPAAAEPSPQPAQAAVAAPVRAAAASDPQPAPIVFTKRWSLAVPDWKEASPIVVSPQATRLAPPSHAAEAAPPRREGALAEVDRYLWEVYQRTQVKSDSSGDFTWKDPAAAKHRGLAMPAYVIGGMEADFREQLYHAGRAMDASGVRWSMLSAFRDDYRQGLASGLKAHGGNSQHGGSNATGGYGHGRAIDVTNADGEPSVVWHWLDVHGATYGLHRPMPGYDPAHVQPRNAWHDLAQHLREARVKLAGDTGANPTEPPTGSTRVSARVNRTN